MEAKAKTLKTLKLAFQSFAKAKTEMASFEMGVVGSSPTRGAIKMKVAKNKLLLFFATYRCYSRESEDVNCFKVFALPVEAKAKTEMASFEMGVVGSSPTKVEP